jgi:hypothetical protein
LLFKVAGREVDGWALNISRGGLRAILDEPLDLGTEVEVTIADGEPRLSRIVWIQEEPDGAIVGGRVPRRRGARSRSRLHLHPRAGRGVAQTPVAADDPVSGPEPRARRSAKETLGPDGPFASRAGYERRDEQLAMAEAVERALEDDTVLLCEAGTGVGKTLAYLVPAVLSGKRVVVSTATRALQDQIATRDLPAIARALGREPSVAIAKGLSNYVCLRRLAEARRATDLGAARRSLPVVAEWALASKTGDIAELTTVAEDDPVWADVTSSSETRVGASCAHFDECFVTRMRRELSAARIVLVNHHLFFADLALRAKAGPAAERAGVLPPYDAVIFDEGAPDRGRRERVLRRARVDRPDRRAAT